MKKTKKTLSFILAALMSASVMVCSVVTAGAADDSFNDVSAKDWYHESVQYVYDTGIMDGVGGGKFAPKETLTRAMGVTLLYRIAGEPDADNLNNPFSDVGSSKWYTDSVKWAFDRGVVTGKSAVKFAPNANITRAEFATILARYADYADLTLPTKRSGNVKDAAEIPAYASSAVSEMYRAEIINGRSDGSFDPASQINRAEAAAMIERFVNTSSDDTVVFEGESSTAEGMLVKEKQYKYGSANVAVLSVENQNADALTVTIRGYYKDANGDVIKTETKTFDGFPGGWHNYFVFNPGIKFVDFDFELTTKAFSGELLANHVHAPYETRICLDIRNKDGSFKGLDQATAEEIAECERFHVELKSYQTYEKPLNYYTETVLFDNNGEIRTIVTYTFSNIGGKNNTGIHNAVAGLGASASNPCCKTPFIDKNLIQDMDKCTSISAIGSVEITIW